MRNVFSTETTVYKFCLRMSAILWMGVLWFFASLPIVTAGASTAALYRMMFDLRNQEPATFSKFFRAFVDNFKKATLVWLLLLVWAAGLAGLYYGTPLVETAALKLVLLAVFIPLFFAWLSCLATAGPLTAFFENAVFGTLKMGFAMLLRHYRYTIVAMVLAVLPVMVAVMLPYLFLRLLFVWILILPGFLAYATAGQMEQAFAPYQEKPPENEEEII